MFHEESTHRICMMAAGGRTFLSRELEGEEEGRNPGVGGDRIYGDIPGHGVDKLRFGGDGGTPEGCIGAFCAVFRQTIMEKIIFVGRQARRQTRQ